MLAQVKKGVRAYIGGQTAESTERLEVFPSLTATPQPVEPG